jgi:hypothetical protein
VNQEAGAKLVLARWFELPGIPPFGYSPFRVTVVIGLYLTILIANMGGYVDKIRMSQIREDVNMRAPMMTRDAQVWTRHVRMKKIEESIRLQEKRLGLDQPFRCAQL